MNNLDCDKCEFAGQCPVEKSGSRYVLHHTPAQRRLAARRAEQATDEFNENYSIRGGIELRYQVKGVSECANPDDEDDATYRKWQRIYSPHGDYTWNVIEENYLGWYYARNYTEDCPATY